MERIEAAAQKRQVEVKEMEVKAAMDKMEKEVSEMKVFLKTCAEKLSFLERRSDTETGAVTDVFRHLCQHLSCFSIEVALGEVKVLMCWLLETKMSFIKPLSLTSISSDQITEAFSQVLKMCMETQQIEDQNSVKVLQFEFMSGSGAEHAKKFKEYLEAAVLQKQLTLKNCEREAVKAFLKINGVKVEHVFLQTQL